MSAVVAAALVVAASVLAGLGAAGGVALLVSTMIRHRRKVPR